MERFGLTAEDFEDEDIWVLPENWQSVTVFGAMSTQWRVGPGGPYGIDYNALPEVWRRLKVPPSQRDDVFDDVRIMEMAALKELSREKE